MGGARLLVLRSIGKDQDMPLGLVFKKIVNAFALHEARDKIEICLAVLNAVVELGVFVLSEPVVELNARILRTGENTFDDFRNSFVLKYAAIGGELKQPKPGHEFRPIVGKALIAMELPELTDDAVNIAFDVFPSKGDSRVAADQILGLDFIVVALLNIRKELQFDREWSRYFFRADQTLDQERRVVRQYNGKVEIRGSACRRHDVISLAWCETLIYFDSPVASSAMCSQISLVDSLRKSLTASSQDLFTSSSYSLWLAP